MANPFDQFDGQANPFDQFDAKAGKSGAKPITRTEKVIQGMRDPIDGGAQLLERMLPQSIVNAGNRINNIIADKTGLLARVPEGGVDQMVRERESQYQQGRAAAGESGFDGYRLAGNVASPVNLAAGARLPQLATLGGRVTMGTAMGAASGALTPVYGNDFGAEKLKQIGIGAAGGGVTPMVTKALSRVISPNATRNANLQLLKSEGVRPTAGQALGGRWNAFEEKLQSLPIMGDAIASARTRSLNDFNNAAINRASGQVGAKVEGVGQNAVREAGDALSDAYQSAMSQVRAVRLDQQFNADLSQLHGMSQSLAPDLSRRFDKTLRDVVMRKVSPQGSILGGSYKEIDSELGNLVSRYAKSTVASEQEFGDAVAQMQNLLRQQMIRSNPQVAEKIAKADAGWANLVRIEGAAKSAKNAEGLFTPAQLNTAVQSADDSVRGRAVSRGKALMQDLSNAGQSVLGNRVPNSFTTDRALIAGGALGSYFVNPAIPAALAGGAAMYSRPAQNTLAALISSRPQSAQAVANAFDQYAPTLIPLGAQIGLGFNK